MKIDASEQVPSATDARRFARSHREASAFVTEINSASPADAKRLVDSYLRLKIKNGGKMQGMPQRLTSKIALIEPLLQDRNVARNALKEFLPRLTEEVGQVRAGRSVLNPPSLLRVPPLDEQELMENMMSNAIDQSHNPDKIRALTTALLFSCLNVDKDVNENMGIIQLKGELLKRSTVINKPFIEDALVEFNERAQLEALLACRKKSAKENPLVEFGPPLGFLADLGSSEGTPTPAATRQEFECYLWDKLSIFNTVEENQQRLLDETRKALRGSHENQGILRDVHQACSNSERLVMDLRRKAVVTQLYGTIGLFWPYHGTDIKSTFLRKQVDDMARFGRLSAEQRRRLPWLPSEDPGRIDQ